MKIVVSRNGAGFCMSIKGLYEYVLRKYGKAYIYVCTAPGIFTKQTDEEIAKNINKWLLAEAHITKEDFGDTAKDLYIHGDVMREEYIKRDDPVLIQVLEDLGDDAQGPYSKIEIIDIPDDVKEWEIEEKFGYETIVEKHRKW